MMLEMEPRVQSLVQSTRVDEKGPNQPTGMKIEQLACAVHKPTGDYLSFQSNGIGIRTARTIFYIVIEWGKRKVVSSPEAMEECDEEYFPVAKIKRGEIDTITRTPEQSRSGSIVLTTEFLGNTSEDEDEERNGNSAGDQR